MLETNFKGLMIAEVMNNVDPKCEGRIQVNIPRLMPDNSLGEELQETEITDLSNEFLANRDKFGFESVVTTNGYWMRPTFFIEGNTESNMVNGGNYKVPNINQKVFVLFLDEDPQKGYYLPITPTIEGEQCHDLFAGPNFSIPEKKINIDRQCYENGSSIQYDYNSERNCYSINIHNPNTKKSVDIEIFNGEHTKINMKTPEQHVIIDDAKGMDIFCHKDTNIENKNNITIKNGNSILIENANNIDIKNSNNVTVSCNNLSITADNTISMTAGSNMTFESPHIKLKGSSISMEGDEVVSTVHGNYSVIISGAAKIISGGNMNIGGAQVHFN